MTRTKKTLNAGACLSINLGVESKLWLTADKFRKKMNAAEYEYVVIPALAA